MAERRGVHSCPDSPGVAPDHDRLSHACDFAFLADRLQLQSPSTFWRTHGCSCSKEQSETQQCHWVKVGMPTVERRPHSEHTRILSRPRRPAGYPLQRREYHRHLAFWQFHWNRYPSLGSAYLVTLRHFPKQFDSGLHWRSSASPQGSSQQKCRQPEALDRGLQILVPPHRRLGDHWRSCSPSARVTR